MTLKIYHYTDSYQSALQILQTRRWLSKENPRYIYFTNRRGDQALGYGKYAISVNIPEDIANLDDEFPDGELHYAVLDSKLRRFAKNYEVIFPVLSEQESELVLFHVSDSEITHIREKTSEDPGGDFGSTLFFAQKPYAPFGDWKAIYKLNCLKCWMVPASGLQHSIQDLEDVSNALSFYSGREVSKSHALGLLLSDDSPYAIFNAVYNYEFDRFFELFGAHFSTEGLDWQSLHLFAWWLQGKQSRVAKRMGYLGVKSFDEQGAVWMVDMLGKEYLLKAVCFDPSLSGDRKS